MVPIRSFAAWYRLVQYSYRFWKWKAGFWKQPLLKSENFLMLNPIDASQSVGTVAPLLQYMTHHKLEAFWNQLPNMAILESPNKSWSSRSGGIAHCF